MCSGMAEWEHSQSSIEIAIDLHIFSCQKRGQSTAHRTVAHRHSSSSSSYSYDGKRMWPPPPIIIRSVVLARISRKSKTVRYELFGSFPTNVLPCEFLRNQRYVKGTVTKCTDEESDLSESHFLSLFLSYRLCWLVRVLGMVLPRCEITVDPAEPVRPCRTASCRPITARTLSSPQPEDTPTWNLFFEDTL